MVREYIDSKKGTPFILQEEILPLFVEEQVLTSLELLNKVNIVPAKDGAFEILVKQTTYKDFITSTKEVEAAETSDFVAVREQNDKWVPASTIPYKYIFPYSSKLKNNDPTGKIVKGISDTATFIGDVLNKQIRATTIAKAEGDVPDPSTIDWIGNPVAALEIIKQTFNDTEKRYNLDSILLKPERYNEFRLWLLNPDNAIAFSDMFGYTPPMTPIKSNSSSDWNDGVDYIAFDSTKMFGQLYSNLDEWGLSANTPSKSLEGDVPLTSSWEEQDNANATLYKTFMLADAGFGMLRTRSVCVGTLIPTP
jgi:hypothetical protein